VISFTLFTGAIFIEACSVAVVMASPWTRAHWNESSFLLGLCNFATSLFKAAVHQSNKRHSTSMGQFNFTDHHMAMKYKPSIMSKAICAIGLEMQWRNLWYVHHIIDDDSSGGREGIISCVLEIFDRPTDEWFRPLRRLRSRRLNYTLSLPFEHAHYRLHLYTDLHISRHLSAHTNSSDVLMRVKEECEKLSNYMMYLMVVYPFMLPVSTASEDLQSALVN
jgi:hypothetical protein